MAEPGAHPVPIFTWPYPQAASSRKSSLTPCLEGLGLPLLTSRLLPEICCFSNLFLPSIYKIREQDWLEFGFFSPFPVLVIPYHFLLPM